MAVAEALRHVGVSTGVHQHVGDQRVTGHGHVQPRRQFAHRHIGLESRLGALQTHRQTVSHIGLECVRREAFEPQLALEHQRLQAELSPPVHRTGRQGTGGRLDRFVGRLGGLAVSQAGAELNAGR